MTEKEKMIRGKLYETADEELLASRNRAHHLCHDYNALYETDDKRQAILKELLQSTPDNLYLTGPIYFDYGFLTRFGKNCYANFNFTVLDCAPVTIGDDVFFGPNVSIMTPMHSFLPKERNCYFNDKGVWSDKEYAKPITIESNCWIASNVTILGGVHIGEGCVIGAGSVVSKDIPPFSLAVGNPCRVIRTISEEDSVYLKKELF